jgi:hypothetical protein
MADHRRLLLGLSENEECTEPYRDAFLAAIVNRPATLGNTRWGTFLSVKPPAWTKLVRALLQCHVIHSRVELAVTLEFAAYLNKQGAFDPRDVKEITTRFVPLLLLSPKFADDRVRWYAMGAAAHMVTSPLQVRHGGHASPG